MKLSEAIREGSKHGPMCQRAYFYGNACCALGAAYFAATSTDNECDSGALVRIFPELGAPPPLSMKLFGGMDTLFDTIVQLNDDGYHETTREQIADMLEAEGL